VAKAVAPGPRRVSDGGDVGPGTACALSGGGCAGGVGEEAAGSARVGVGGGIGVVPTRAGSMVAAERGPGLGTKSTGRGRSRGRKLGCADRLNWDDSATCMYENSSCTRKAGSSTSLQNTGSRGWPRSRFGRCGGGGVVNK